MNKKLGIYGILAVCLIASIGAVGAVSQDITVQSDIAPSFSCSIAAGAQTFPLVIGINEKAGNNLTVASNTGYVIKAKDKMINSKPVGTAGKMVNIDTTNGGWVGTGLTNKFEMKFNGGTYVQLSEVDQTIFSASAGELTAPLGFKQIATAGDPVPGANHKYQIELAVTCSAPA